MYDLSEESVARLLIRDAQQLADRAKGHTKGKEAHVQRHAESPRQRAQLNVDSGVHGTEEDFGVSALLSSKPVRGRGGVGSRVEETGPYLRAEANSARESSNSPEDNRLLGPNCPDWIRQASGPIEDAAPGRRCLLGPDKFSRLRNKRVGTPIEVGRVSKDTSAAQKHKKAKKKHKHKHKHRHKEID
ncbi:TPA: hypothetical protein ACH3X3_001558 [Trebouxia sp. C0006]